MDLTLTPVSVVDSHPLHMMNWTRQNDRLQEIPLPIVFPPRSQGCTFGGQARV